MAIIDEIAATDSPALRAMKGSVIVRNPCAIPEGSVTSAKTIGLGQSLQRFDLSEEIRCLIRRVEPSKSSHNLCPVQSEHEYEPSQMVRPARKITKAEHRPNENKLSQH